MRTILSRSSKNFHQSHQRWPRKFAIATGLALATFALFNDLAIPAYAQEATPLNSGGPAAAAKPIETTAEKVVKSRTQQPLRSLLFDSLRNSMQLSTHPLNLK
jgi:hypothetical protein